MCARTVSPLADPAHLLVARDSATPPVRRGGVVPREIDGGRRPLRPAAAAAAALALAAAGCIIVVVAAAAVLAAAVIAVAVAAIGGGGDGGRGGARGRGCSRRRRRARRGRRRHEIPREDIGYTTTLTRVLTQSKTLLFWGWILAKLAIYIFSLHRN